MGGLMDAPNQQAVRADGSGPGIEASQSGPVERSIAQAGPPPAPPPGPPPAAPGEHHRPRHAGE